MSKQSREGPIRRSKRPATVSSSNDDTALYILIDSPEKLPKTASRFNLEDAKALNTVFIGAKEPTEVIPSFDSVQDKDLPSKILLPSISEVDFVINVDKINSLELSDDAKTFFFQMAKMIKNEDVVAGTSETKTDSVVMLILNSIGTWPLNLSLHQMLNFMIYEHNIKADLEFALASRNIILLIVEDKHLRNITVDNGCGEPQIVAELLAAAFYNRQHGMMKNQTLYAVRFICSYVTFYRFEVEAEYFQELALGLPATKNITLTRWPQENYKTSGIDIKTKNGRHDVLLYLLALCNYAKNFVLN